MFLLYSVTDLYQQDTTDVNKGTEAATGGVLCKKVFLKISQNSQENTCARASFVIKFQAYGLQLY